MFINLLRKILNKNKKYHCCDTFFVASFIAFLIASSGVDALMHFNRFLSSMNLFDSFLAQPSNLSITIIGIPA